MDARTPDEPRQSFFYRGCEFSRAEIELAVNDLVVRAALLKANVKTLNENFSAQKTVETKLACENIACVAGDAKKSAAQIEALAAMLARTLVTHMARRARV